MKNFIVYLLFMALTIYLLIMYSRPSMLLVFCFAAALLLVLAILAWSFRKTVKIDMPEDTPAIDKGKKIPVSVTLKNASIFPVPYYKLIIRCRHALGRESEKLIFYGSIAGRGKTRAEWIFQGDYCGQYEFEISKLSCYDFLKIFSFRQKPKEKMTLMILPDIHPASVIPGYHTLNNPVDSDTYSKHKGGDDPSEVFKIREYQNGDKPQNIHWKITAKEGTPMVKENSLPIGYQVLLLIDFRSDFVSGIPAETFQNITEAILACSNSLLEYHCFHYISWYNESHGQLERSKIHDFDSLSQSIPELLGNTPHTPVEDLYSLYKDTFLYSPHHVVIRVNPKLEIYVNDDLAGKLDRNNIENSLQGLHLAI